MILTMIGWLIGLPPLLLALWMCGLSFLSTEQSFLETSHAFWVLRANAKGLDSQKVASVHDALLPDHSAFETRIQTKGDSQELEVSTTEGSALAAIREIYDSLARHTAKKPQVSDMKRVPQSFKQVWVFKK